MTNEQMIFCVLKEHTMTDREQLAMMAELKDKQFAQEKQQWIDKACEWWENELTYPTMTQADIDDFVLGRIKEFKQAMKGDNYESEITKTS
jgi:hypothetical protein